MSGLALDLRPQCDLVVVRDLLLGVRAHGHRVATVQHWATHQLGVIMNRSILALALLAIPVMANAGDTNFASRIVIQQTDSPPSCTYATANGELCVAQDIETRANLYVAGTTTFSSTLAATGAITGLRKVIAGGSAYTVVAPDDCGAVITTATDNAVITLPDAAAGNKGCQITLFNTGADTAALISLSPHSSDGIDGNCIGTTGAGAATLVNLSGTVDKDAQNTKATSNKGDSITVVSDGTAGWYVVNCMGIWASQG